MSTSAQLSASALVPADLLSSKSLNRGTVKLAGSNCSRASEPSWDISINSAADKFSKRERSWDISINSTGDKVSKRSSSNPCRSFKAACKGMRYKPRRGGPYARHRSYRPLRQSSEQGESYDVFTEEGTPLEGITLPGDSNLGSEPASTSENSAFDTLMGAHTPLGVYFHGATAEQRFMNFAKVKAEGRGHFTPDVQRYHQEVWKSASEWAEDLHSQGASFQINDGEVRSTVGMDLDAFKTSVAVLLSEADSGAYANPPGARTVGRSLVPNDDGSVEGNRWRMERPDKSMGTLSFSLR